MAMEEETEGPVDGVFDADAGGDEDGAWGEAVVAELQWRGGIEQVEAVVLGAGEAQGQAQAAGTGGEQARGGYGRKAAVDGHLGGAVLAGWLEGAEQNAAGRALGLAGDVHAEVAAIDGIDIGVGGGTESPRKARVPSKTMIVASEPRANTVSGQEPVHQLMRSK